MILQSHGRDLLLERLKRGEIEPLDAHFIEKDLREARTAAPVEADPLVDRLNEAAEIAAETFKRKVEAAQAAAASPDRRDPRNDDLFAAVQARRVPTAALSADASSLDRERVAAAQAKRERRRLRNLAR
ncbi:MAG: hypothetical protein EPN91_11310 [Salinibacterium sp.]|nr:MAG: hypothetical protein EPN91_11310 [Salinibacterium sp.]